MENAFIFIIVAIFVAARAYLNKAGADEKTVKEKTFTPTPAPPPALTDADRRYREIQEEIRRRIAQRGPAPSTGTPLSPAPLQDYKPSRKSTQPVSPLRPIFKSKKTAVEAPAAPRVSASPPLEIALPDSVPNEDTAYALPEATDEQGPRTLADASLRAVLASPTAARQAFLLREIFDRPLCLRPVSSGGHEDWN